VLIAGDTGAVVTGAVVTGVAGAGSCCDLAPIGASTIAADVTASAARNRLVNLLSILLLGFCLKSNAANTHLFTLASTWSVITVTLSRLRLQRGGSRNLPKAGGVPYLEFPISCHTASLGLPLN
jgi:hypothetical protein